MELERGELGHLTREQLVQKLGEHEQNIQRDFPLLDAELDRQVAEIRAKEAMSAKETGLAFLGLAEFLIPWLSDWQNQGKQLDSPVLENFSATYAEGVSNFQSRVGYFLEEAEREFRTHLALEPGDVDVLQSLAKTLKLAGKRSEGTRAMEDAKRTELARSGGQVHVPSRRDRTGLSFEAKTLELVRLLGFNAEVTNRSADGGIDILASSTAAFTEGRYVIQCKDWSKPVGEPVVRDLLGTIQKNRAIKGILLSRSGFTPAARNFAEATPIELIDGGNIDGLLTEAHRRAAKPVP